MRMKTICREKFSRAEIKKIGRYGLGADGIPEMKQGEKAEMGLVLYREINSSQ